MSRPPAYAIWSQFAPSRSGALSIQEQLVRFSVVKSPPERFARERDCRQVGPSPRS